MYTCACIVSHVWFIPMHYAWWYTSFDSKILKDVRHTHAWDGLQSDGDSRFIIVASRDATPDGSLVARYSMVIPSCEILYAAQFTKMVCLYSHWEQKTTLELEPLPLRTCSSTLRDMKPNYFSQHAFLVLSHPLPRTSAQAKEVLMKLNRPYMAPWNISVVNMLFGMSFQVE